MIMAYKFNNLIVKVLSEGETVAPCQPGISLAAGVPCQPGISLAAGVPCQPGISLAAGVPCQPGISLAAGVPCQPGISLAAAAPCQPGISLAVGATPALESAGLDQLTALQQQLAALQAHVAQRIEAATAADKPQTVAEAEDLERKLQGALEQLRAHKQTLRK
jgi:hypothetical protein